MEKMTKSIDDSYNQLQLQAMNECLPLIERGFLQTELRTHCGPIYCFPPFPVDPLRPGVEVSLQVDETNFSIFLLFCGSFWDLFSFGKWIIHEVTAVLWICGKDYILTRNYRMQDMTAERMAGEGC